ncbi:DUF2500 domain-containing protein [Paenibacillus physcomitrellae]|uniref:DUF2500 domain-containing protein n=1 Tax=Paenibacillus physcomitrellae TaxID=1619311 RepID=A0ABQ1GSF3_9BACL|nr:DUF2500 domain-containing protein [Paenibacillus physcomitrellae]GGA49526.1 hypothetical protein GCM10010917_38500 [Paenibacillus physcomitrellae]
MFPNSPSGFSPDTSGFDFLFSVFPYLFVLVFLLIVGSLLFRGARYAKNAASPRQSAFVKVVAKRTRVEHHSGTPSFTDEHFTSTPSHSHTYYYITLEFEDGERKEFLDVKGLYGLVAEDDTGFAAVQGDWIVAFERTAAPSYYS